MGKKILIAAGGTGGHVFPAIAVADAIKKIDPSHEIVFVGSSHGPESRWIEAAKYRFRSVDVRFLTGAKILEKVKRLFSLFKTARQCKRLLREEAPDIVLGSGGYVSGPTLAMAALKRYPTAIMEQNAIAGLTNRILGKFVDRIFVSFDVAYPFKRAKLRFLGNPVRDLASPVEMSREGEDLHIFVFGGSQGAQSLNEGVPRALRALSLEQLSKIRVLHQTGRGKLEETKQVYADCACADFRLSEFIDDMGAAYSWADLVICRAGATSIAEITSLGKASVLVPFPFAAHGHQDKNADAMVAYGASWKIGNDRIEADLPEVIDNCLSDRSLLVEKGQRALAKGKPRASHEVAQSLLELL